MFKKGQALYEGISKRYTILQRKMTVFKVNYRDYKAKKIFYLNLNLEDFMLFYYRNRGAFMDSYKNLNCGENLDFHLFCTAVSAHFDSCCQHGSYICVRMVCGIIFSI